MDIDELIECRILKRISRFTVIVEINNVEVQVYLGNSGRLLQFMKPGNIGYLTKVEGRGRKHSYKLLGVKDGDYAAIVDTKIHEDVFAVLTDRDLLPWLQGFRISRRYPRVDGRILDYLLIGRGSYVLVEIKSAVLRLPSDIAGYPDAPTSRGRQHLKLLADKATKHGYEPLVVFICALPNIKKFQLYCEEDREIGAIARYAQEKGVKFKAIGIYLDPYRKKIVLENPDIPVELECYKHQDLDYDLNNIKSLIC